MLCLALYGAVHLGMTTIGVTELRAQLKGVLERVKQGEAFTITQNDEAVAALLHPSKLPPRVSTPSTVAAEELMTALAQARHDRLERGEGISRTRAETMVEELRAERDSWD
ncbi:hypothetical protein BH24DEI2_BH24DEI2_22360 [soil metagenome]